MVTVRNKVPKKYHVPGHIMKPYFNCENLAPRQGPIKHGPKNWLTEKKVIRRIPEKSKSFCNLGRCFAKRTFEILIKITQCHYPVRIFLQNGTTDFDETLHVV